LGLRGYHSRKKRTPEVGGKSSDPKQVKTRSIKGLYWNPLGCGSKRGGKQVNVHERDEIPRLQLIQLKPKGE